MAMPSRSNADATFIGRDITSFPDAEFVTAHRLSDGTMIAIPCGPRSDVIVDRRSPLPREPAIKHRVHNLLDVTISLRIVVRVNRKWCYSRFRNE